jgi:hypothetical protein
MTSPSLCSWTSASATLVGWTEPLTNDSLSRKKSLQRRTPHDTETDFPPSTDKRRGLLDRAFVVLNWLLFPLNSLRAGKPPKRT